MLHASCFCKKIQIEWSGQPGAIALCHCKDCRKLSGSPYTLNFLAKTSDLKIRGSPKEIPKLADGGNAVKNYFCSDCGSPLYGGAVSENGELDTVVIRAGIFDDVDLLDESKPVVEIYVAQRLKWIAPIDGCGQFDGMLPSS